MPLCGFKIPGLRVVGMHHYGASSLVLDVAYVARREPENKYDPKAVAIKDGQITKGYLKRDDAHRLAVVIDSGLLKGETYLKCHHMACVKTQKTGPEQLCNVGIRCDTSDKKKVEDLLDFVCLSYDILTFH